MIIIVCHDLVNLSQQKISQIIWPMGYKVLYYHQRWSFKTTFKKVNMVCTQQNTLKSTEVYKTKSLSPPFPLLLGLFPEDIRY